MEYNYIKIYHDNYSNDQNINTFTSQSKGQCRNYNASAFLTTHHISYNNLSFL